jgi:hypothetical protein
MFGKILKILLKQELWFSTLMISLFAAFISATTYTLIAFIIDWSSTHL